MSGGGGRTRPPGGRPAPTTSQRRDGTLVDVETWAREACRRYRAEFPDEDERYGADVAIAWCRHDLQWLLHWAVEDAEGIGDLQAHVEWLARVLRGRDFPLERLARGLRHAAAVTSEARASEVTERLRAAARRVDGLADPSSR